MKKILLLTFLLSIGSVAQAQASYFPVSDERLERLEALHTEAESRIARNDFYGAVRIYEDIILLEPDDETAYTNLGRIHMILGDNGKAEVCFQNALTINPQNETAVLGLQKIKDPDSGFVVSEEELEESRPKPHAPQPVAPAAAPADALSYEKQVQIALKNAGLYHGALDGVIGRRSYNAIVDFQKIHGLKVDGKAGSETWAKLKPYYFMAGETQKDPS